MNYPPSEGPLAGVRIIELANIIAGPTAGQILGDFGAEVIKIEHPDGGDGSRRQGRQKNGVPLWWKILGRNKRSVGMYLGDPDAAEIFCRLVATADVVVEGFRPGTMERWNLGYDRLVQANPRIIFVRLSGFGQTGPYAHRPAFGTNIESMTGYSHLNGPPDGPPTLPPFGTGDYFAGVTVTSAILMALYHRDAKGGSGQVVDASLFQPLMMTMARPVIHYDQLGFEETRTGNQSDGTAPRNAYLTKDKRWIAVSAATYQIAEKIMAMVGRPEFAKEPWFRTNAGRVQHGQVLDEAVRIWIETRTAEEVMAASQEAQVTFAPMYDVPDMLSDVHVRETGMIAEVKDDDFGKVRMPNVLFKMSETPGRIRWAGQTLGASTDSVLVDELGVDPGDISRLRKRGVVR
jgi:crotonobetainyl-CoA:carnitine CoA-transferase CaiB-like acyl-CoA transferase